MVYQKQTDSQLFGKRFQFADNLIIAGIAAFFVSGFPNLLQRVDNNKVCIRVFPAKGLDLLVKSAAQRLCCIGKVERGRNICTEHTIKPLLQSLLIVLQSQIGAYDITADELLARTDTTKTESKTAQAQMLILELLADGKRMPSAELEKAVNERGISSRTMRTAKSRIGDRLVTEKDGTAWVCYLRD